MSGCVIERQPLPAFNSDYIAHARVEHADTNQHPIGDAIGVMLVIMNLLSSKSTAVLDDMQKKSNISRDAQDMANNVEAALAKLVKPEDKTAVPGEVLEYMRANHILVSGKTIDEFVASKTKAGQDATKSAQMIEKMHSMIEKAGSEGMTSKPWQEVVSYMDSLGIKIDGKRVCDYIWSLPEVNYRSDHKISVDHMKTLASALQGAISLDKADLMSVKSSLESVSTRASDFIQQCQLKMQQLMQNYNTAVEMIKSLQAMLADSTSGIAKAIR
ncbi:secretion protein EspA [Burkholderia sp. Nafp2/4-1b]|uniref:secretion protein EspA n=1 Tax=Burkholderia sp. Nafp2/4-1b TaxID=2116686 RepID=UPI000EF96E2D|nr:secretion protein EspA [Burkholderia sp. Nafp2/4-1b]RKT98757.1 secretion protein EspA [Burkholderia sp. Nafp2/4-1b]